MRPKKCTTVEVPQDAYLCICHEKSLFMLTREMYNALIRRSSLSQLHLEDIKAFTGVSQTSWLG